MNTISIVIYIIIYYYRLVHKELPDKRAEKILSLERENSLLKGKLEEKLKHSQFQVPLGFAQSQSPPHGYVEPQPPPPCKHYI